MGKILNMLNQRVKKYNFRSIWFFFHTGEIIWIQWEDKIVFILKEADLEEAVLNSDHANDS